MKKIIEWIKQSNRWKHLLGGILIGLGANDWYCAAYSGIGIASAIELKDKLWERFENAFSPLYCSNNGRPAHPIRLMCGLLILKHLRNVSDEMVVFQWSENAYYQYF